MACSLADEEEEIMNSIPLHSIGFCSCFTMIVQTDLRQNYRGSVSIMAQCIENQFMLNKSSGNSLQSMCWSLFPNFALKMGVCEVEPELV